MLHNTRGWKYLNLFLVILTILSKRLCLNFCLDEKFSQKFSFKNNLLKKNASTNDKGTRFLTINKIRFSSNPSPMGNPKEISPCLKEPQNLLSYKNQ